MKPLSLALYCLTVIGGLVLGVSAAWAREVNFDLLVLRRGRERASPGEQPLLTQAARELGLE
jgi:hypothetical protein